MRERRENRLGAHRTLEPKWLRITLVKSSGFRLGFDLVSGPGPSGRIGPPWRGQPTPPPERTRANCDARSACSTRKTRYPTSPARRVRSFLNLRGMSWTAPDGPDRGTTTEPQGPWADLGTSCREGASIRLLSFPERNHEGERPTPLDTSGMDFLAGLGFDLIPRSGRRRPQEPI